MSGGRAAEGAGWVSWWGFSPALDLLTAGPQRVKRQGEEVNVLLVGSGDPRHILKTIAGLQNEQSLHVWVIENSMEVLARQLLLLYLALMPQESIGLHEKTEVYLEVFGNSEIRSQTEEIVKHAASQLSLCVSETVETAAHTCLNTALLKCGVITKQEYVRWRERGLAFEMREGVYHVTNPSLLSFRVFKQRGNSVAVRGYWGDIVSSPFLCFGTESADKSHLKTHHEQHVQTARDISFANVQLLFQALSSRRRTSSTPPSDTERQERQQQESTHTDHTSVTVNDLMRLSGITVTFLPVDSLHKLPQKTQYSHFFHIIYLSLSCVQHLGSAIAQIAAPDAVVVMELAKFILDLNKDEEAEVAKTATLLARHAGLQPWHEGKSDDAHAVFIPQKKKK